MRTIGEAEEEIDCDPPVLVLMLAMIDDNVWLMASLEVEAGHCIISSDSVATAPRGAIAELLGVCKGGAAADADKAVVTGSRPSRRILA